MADITMCTGENCSLKDDCYRYKALPNLHMQSMFVTPPVLNDKCKSFQSTSGYPPEMLIKDPEDKEEVLKRIQDDVLECHSCGDDISHESESLQARELCSNCI